VSVNLNIPYSAQYNTITREGHERPPPSFGAPTLIWHLAVSPHWLEETRATDAPLEALHTQLATEYEATRASFFEGMNELLVLLQKQASSPPRKPETFDPNKVQRPWDEPREALGKPFFVTEPANIRFTLWWRDDDAKLVSEPSEDALRVRVHVTAHRDFVTFSFYIDAGKPWNKPALVRGQRVPGERRQRIFSQVGNIQNECEDRLKVGSEGVRPVDREVLPEVGITEAQAKGLMGASRYLYSDIWDEFCGAFDIKNLESLIGKDPDGNERIGSGRVFANFRGLVISTPGLNAVEEKFPGSSGAQPFPRFAGNGGLDAKGVSSSKEDNEANAVVKAFWPFIRRITPYADLREFIACGVMSWRALYVTALGSPRAFDWKEECLGSKAEIPAGHLPEELIDASGKYDSLHGDRREGPLRYLILTKGEPHRHQIGRIADRINAIGTLRLIALRDWNIIRDASTQIQLRGQQLDTMMRRWSTKRSEIREDFDLRRKGKSADELSALQDEEDGKIQKLADDVEKDLIYLSASLDRVGVKAVHGLHFRINRSRYYVCEFESLLASLKIGNIDTWVSYDQFVTRGLKPAFEFIDGVGDRLLGLRTRLQSVLEGIETSALVKQSSATRQNTAELRSIAKEFAKLQKLLRSIGLLLALAGLLVTLFGYQGVLGRIWGLLQSQ
jgi:hypothetical protein